MVCTGAQVSGCADHWRYRGNVRHDELSGKAAVGSWGRSAALRYLFIYLTIFSYLVNSVKYSFKCVSGKHLSIAIAQANAYLMLPVACDWVEPFLLQPKAFSAPHPWEELTVVTTGWVRCHSAVWACWHASEIPSVWKVCAGEESSLSPRSMDSSRELPWNSQRTLGLHDLECIGKEEGNTTYLLKSQVGKTEKGKTLANQQYAGWSFFCFPDQGLMAYKDEGRRAGWKDLFSWWCFLSELSEAVI